MPYISLEQAKAHLIVEHDEDNDYILELILTAEDALSGMLGRPLADTEVAGELPHALRHALKMLVAKLYANREGDRSGKVTEVGFTLSNLIMPYKLIR